MVEVGVDVPCHAHGGGEPERLGSPSSASWGPMDVASTREHVPAGRPPRRRTTLPGPGWTRWPPPLTASSSRRRT
ncbi:hypothetical protein QJS66_00860 [Kocuria rhizophila]|nr:hypothetical protein QJS66_00860 [Kocuria rhizophila]